MQTGPFATHATHRVSYVLATKNRAAFLDSALESFQALKSPDDELIIVDGGSEDDTAEVVKRHADKVDVFVSEPDVSEPHAVNKGILLARGRYVKQLTDDDVIHRAGMEQAVAILDDHPEIDILQCGGVREMGGQETPFFISKAVPYGRRPDDVIRVGVCGVGIITRRAAYARLGLYNTTAIAPDGDFVANAIAKGGTVRFCRVNLFHHPILEHSVTQGGRRLGYERDVLRIMREHAPRATYSWFRLKRTLRRIPLVGPAVTRVRALNRGPAPVVWDGGIS